MKLTSIKALELLKKDVIENDDDLKKTENKWMLHCICVGNTARVIARNLNLDEDYVCALGYIHDIGRKIDHPNHAYEGYRYMVENGYPEEASVCLTHSFINNDIYLIAGGEVEEGDIKEYIKDYLSKRELTLEDNIIQMCDLLCLPTGVTTLERRLLDIYSRKGIHSNTKAHYEEACALKLKLERLLGVDIYTLFENIKSEDIESIDEDKEKIANLLNDNKINILRK